MKNTAVVVSTYSKTFTGGWNAAILDHTKQNFENLFLLFDNKEERSDEEISKYYPGLKLSSYGPKEFSDNNFNREISRRHRWGSHQNPNYFYAHFRMLLFYMKNPTFDYYWFFDDDIKFTGDLKGLLSTYENSPEDFIAIQVFKKRDYEEFPKVSVINTRMGSNGQWLDFAPGPGDKYKSTFCHMGSFFPIVRFSRKALEHLVSLNREGFYGYSEGFVPTSLASDGFSVASMLDEHDKYFENVTAECSLIHKGIPFIWTWI